MAFGQTLTTPHPPTPHMFRLFSHGRRVRHVSSRRTGAAPVLQCGFARQTHDNHDSSPHVMNNASSVGVMRANSFGFRLSDFNPVKMVQEMMKDAEGVSRFKLDIKPSFFIISIVVVIALSTIMTLVFSTKGVTKGYKLRDLETQSQKLVRQNEVMTMQLSRAQSLNAVVNNDVLLHMRPAQKVMYMSGSSAIASR